MNKPIRTVMFSSALLLGSLAALPSGAMQSGMDMDKMEQMIVTASKQTDHQALAAQYASEAQSLRELAAHHKAMARAYDLLAGGSTKGGSKAFAGHCFKLAAKYEEAAAEYAALATLHQQFAAELAQKSAGANS